MRADRKKKEVEGILGKTFDYSRNSSIELLRIISMVFIVISHSCVHGGFYIIYDYNTLNSLFVQWGTLGNLGVDIFVLISGYFMCKKELKMSTYVKLISQVWFYSFAIYFVCAFIFEYEYSLIELAKVICPTIFGEYWFFTAYIVLLIFSPFLNMLFDAISKYEFKKLLLCMIILWVVIPTFTAQKMYGTELLQLVIFYTIGAYFRYYDIKILKNKKNRLILIGVSFALMFLSTIVLNYLGQYFDIFVGRSTIFYERNSLLTLCCAVGLFSAAVYKKKFTNKNINVIASCVFGVYLIHDNPIVRKILWLDIFKNNLYFDNDFFIVRMIVCVLIVFVVCIIIEYIRQKTVKKYTDKFVERVFKIILKPIDYFLHP